MTDAELKHLIELAENEEIEFLKEFGDTKFYAEEARVMEVPITTVKAMAEELLAARAMRDKMMIENGIKWDNPDSVIIAGHIMARLLMNYDAIRANKNRDEGK